MCAHIYLTKSTSIFFGFESLVYFLHQETEYGVFTSTKLWSLVKKLSQGRIIHSETEKPSGGLSQISGHVQATSLHMYRKLLFTNLASTTCPTSRACAINIYWFPTANCEWHLLFVTTTRTGDSLRGLLPFFRPFVSELACVSSTSWVFFPTRRDVSDC